MKRLLIVSTAVLVAVLLYAGCAGQEDGEKLVVEETPAFKPNLPAVPVIRPPDVPETYSDGSYSVYGLRKNAAKAIDTKVTVTAYVASIYQKPECAAESACPTLVPNLFLADDKDEKLDRRLLRLTGYAKSFDAIAEAEKAAKSGAHKEPAAGEIAPTPVAWDWRAGQKYKISGLFARHSAAGFMAVDGLLEYAGHECLDCPADEAQKK